MIEESRLLNLFPFLKSKEHLMSKQPVHAIRFGLIKASIWQNQTRAGERYNVTVARLFRDGDVWRESSHFGRSDLLLLSKAVDLAHTWIYQQSAGDPDSSASEPTQ